MRFRAEQHLRRQSDFRNAREKGRRQDCGAFTLWWHRRAVSDAANPDPVQAEPQDQGPRVGVVASAAAVGKAVKRNRAKRRLRAIFRENQKLVPAEYDLLLVARQAVNRLEYREVEQRFVDACRRIFSTSL